MMKVVSLLMSFLRLLLALPVLGRVLNVSLAIFATFVRLGAGGWVASGVSGCARPEKTLILYEYEGCPFCRKVREVLTTLDLDAIIYPCPRVTLKKYGVVEGSRYRPTVIKLGGKASFPFLVDENTNASLYESDDIINYLKDTYGQGSIARINDRIANSTPLKMFGLFMATLFRSADPKFGLLRTPSKLPEQHLELWSTEASPFCKLAREALCSLELPYKVVNVGHGSVAKRAEFRERFGDQLSAARKAAGAVMVPLLVDPNTDTVMVESGDIVKYLFKEYQTGEAPTEGFGDYSTDGASATHGTLPFGKKKAQ